MSNPRLRPAAGTPGRYSYDGLDRILHEKARLGIMTCLLTRPQGLLFNELKHLCALTDGNLSRHLDVLREAGLIEIHKAFQARRPQTTVTLTPFGRQRFRDYLDELERVIRDAQTCPAADPRTQPAPTGTSWLPI
ncbi:transcriptional regulator, ArsR family [Isosphaera pallida ATCC 43644]|uniref:Transcriptional regulator, ArsR family n=1 Tax=Isosphaera pallida (strain ATCC 43644 / DSM 9630 / IS1B) TaxID=575540 RepID=E8R3M5_ISOPI|nr:transcriptional regulator [Isosphaera pallida]ADV61592.1 transcriptional regulator, ArsR family [Isosphaera pallida ATCC 43644]